MKWSDAPQVVVVGTDMSESAIGPTVDVRHPDDAAQKVRPVSDFADYRLGPTLAHGIRARLGNTFVLHSNTDVVPLPQTDPSQTRVRAASSSIGDWMFGQRDVVISISAPTARRSTRAKSHKYSPTRWRWSTPCTARTRDRAPTPCSSRCSIHS